MGLEKGIRKGNFFDMIIFPQQWDTRGGDEQAEKSLRIGCKSLKRTNSDRKKRLKTLRRTSEKGKRQKTSYYLHSLQTANGPFFREHLFLFFPPPYISFLFPTILSTFHWYLFFSRVTFFSSSEGALSSFPLPTASIYRLRHLDASKLNVQTHLNKLTPYSAPFSGARKGKVAKVGKVDQVGGGGEKWR